jgi:hypothetical protein
VAHVGNIATIGVEFFRDIRVLSPPDYERVFFNSVYQSECTYRFMYVGEILVISLMIEWILLIFEGLSLISQCLINMNTP